MVKILGYYGPAGMMYFIQAGDRWLKGSQSDQRKETNEHRTSNLVFCLSKIDK